MRFCVSRRHILRSLALLGAGIGASNALAQTPARMASSAGSLAETAEAAGIAFGSAYDRAALDDPALKALVLGQSRILTIENALKFDHLRPHGPQADFTVADALVALARGAGRALRGHTLVWNDNLPPWLHKLSQPQVQAMMHRHIDEVAGRYAGQIHTWDVVNEPFAPWDRQQGLWRKGPWFSAFGPSYVEEALRRTASVDSRARLAINEAFCEQDERIGRAVRPALLALIRRLKDKGVPLHVVGLQAHLKPQLPHNDEVFVRFLEDLAACGVEIHISELDVDDSSYKGDIAARDDAVARRYEEFLHAVLGVRAVKGVLTWGLDDGHSWYRGQRKDARPLPFDDNLRAKPAAAAIARAFAARRRAD